MFKPYIQGLAALCLFAVLAIVVGLGSMYPQPVGQALLALAIVVLIAWALISFGRRVILWALAVACAGSLAGCGTISAANQDAMAAAVAAKIPYCSGDIQIDAGIGGIAGTGTGIKNSGQLHCPGKPYDTGPSTVTPPTAPVTP